MIKKEITYTDFNGDTHTEDFYFHLTKADILELEIEFDDGLEDMLRSIVKTQDNKAILKIFKLIIDRAYGTKSEDGKQFIKSDDKTKKFSSSAAYEELFMELLTGAEDAAAFIIGCMPTDLQKEIAKNTKESAIEAAADVPSITKTDI